MSSEPKRLYRSRDERMISGVCGGIGKYFNVDPTLIRLLFVIFAFAGGPGLVAYIVLAIIVPQEPVGDYTAYAPPSGEPQATVDVEQAKSDETE